MSYAELATLVIEHLDTPWQIASVHRAVRGGGWRSVKELQAVKMSRNWHPPLYWSGCHERAVPIDGGVLLEKWQVDADCWLPFVRLTMEFSPPAASA